MGNFTDKDMGWKAFMAQMKVNAGEKAGFVGYLRSSGEYKNKSQRGKGEKAKPITMAQLASVHEFGSADGTIPERSFMRSALKENSKFLKRLTHKVASQVLDGKMSKDTGIGLICQKMLDLFAAKIDSNIPPPNKPETVARKGSSHTLIDTGQLKGALDWEIKGKK